MDLFGKNANQKLISVMIVMSKNLIFPKPFYD